MDLGKRGVWRDLGGVEGEETVVRMYCMKEELLFKNLWLKGRGKAGKGSREKCRAQ